jgi:hypothetical protein
VQQNLVCPAAGEGGLDLQVLLHPFQPDALPAQPMYLASAHQRRPVRFHRLLGPDHLQINQGVFFVIDGQRRGVDGQPLREGDGFARILPHANLLEQHGAGFPVRKRRLEPVCGQPTHGRAHPQPAQRVAERPVLQQLLRLPLANRLYADRLLHQRQHIIEQQPRSGLRLAQWNVSEPGADGRRRLPIQRNGVGEVDAVGGRGLVTMRGEDGIDDLLQRWGKVVGVETTAVRPPLRGVDHGADGEGTAVFSLQQPFEPVADRLRIEGQRLDVLRGGARFVEGPAIAGGHGRDLGLHLLLLCCRQLVPRLVVHGQPGLIPEDGTGDLLLRQGAVGAGASQFIKQRLRIQRRELLAVGAPL